MGMNQLNQSLSVSAPLSLCDVADPFHDFSAGAQKYLTACGKTFQSLTNITIVWKMWEDPFEFDIFFSTKKKIAEKVRNFTGGPMVEAA
jgi:hypothetical protein